MALKGTADLLSLRIVLQSSVCSEGTGLEIVQGVPRWYALDIFKALNRLSFAESSG